MWKLTECQIIIYRTQKPLSWCYEKIEHVYGNSKHGENCAEVKRQQDILNCGTIFKQSSLERQFEIITCMFRFVTFE
jgi:hypothetical protein